MLVIVAFVSQKGGVGKSTLARALGSVAAAAKINVKIADLDPQQQTVRRWEERREENDAGPALQVVTVKTAAEAIQAGDEGEQLLIIDGPPRSSRGSLEIAKHADLVVQPSGASIDDLDPAILLFHELTRTGIPKDRLILALSRVGSQAEEKAARAYVEMAGYAVLPGSISERTAYRVAHNAGQAVTEIEIPDQHLRVLMDALLAMITERVKTRINAAKPQKKKASKLT